MRNKENENDMKTRILLNKKRQKTLRNDEEEIIYVELN